MRTLELPLDEARSADVVAAVASMAASGGHEERGAVFTKKKVVEALLDLCEYTVDQPLVNRRLLEPSFGDGSFLAVAVDRLLRSHIAFGGTPTDVDGLVHSIRGVELHTETFQRTHQVLVGLLESHGVEPVAAERLVSKWLINDDFLLANIDGRFDVVVGNPPYVRQERIPNPLLKTYKRRFRTLYDRADLYVMFYERGLDLLAADGLLGYICANRWVKNKYGGPLRKKVADGFRLKYFIDLERADAFHSEVIAYPAITVIERGRQQSTFVALENRESANGIAAVAATMKAAAAGVGHESSIVTLQSVATGRDPWLLDAPQMLGLLRRLEASFPTIESAGAKVGIGVASGADKIFIGKHDELPVEDARKLRLAMAADCEGGQVRWGGKGIVNPYLDSGRLAPFSEFPDFAAYLGANEEQLRKRHTAKKQPDKWYRTIDRIHPGLAGQPKLFIPDIKGEATVAYDPGECYPHHNLYVVTSTTWNLRALQAVLRSSVALAFVAAYCVRMAGGFLRFQAQYLRRIRVPDPAALTEQQVERLCAVAVADLASVDSVVLPLYGLNDTDTFALVDFAASARVMRSTK